MELLEDLDSGMEIRIAYQPHWPLTGEANHLKVRNGVAYICENSYGGNEYAPGGLFDDNDSCTDDLPDTED